MTDIERMKEEKRLQQAEEILRLMGSRLSLAAEGQDPEIDAALGALREQIRGDMEYEAVKGIIDTISRRLMQIDELSAAPAASEPNKDHAFLLQLLEVAPWPEAVMQKVDVLQSQWKQDPPQPQVMLSELVELIRQAASSAGNSAEDGSIVGPLLGQMIDTFSRRVDLGGDLQTKAIHLRQQLENGLNRDSLETAITSFADLLAQRVIGLQKQSRDLEKFLGQLGKRLEVLEAVLSGLADNRSAALADTRALDANVRAEMQDLSADVSRATDLQQLKQSIQGKFDHLLAQVSNYCAREENRNQDLERRIEQLQSRVHAMEKESEALRSLLASEHAAATTDALTGLPNRAAYEDRLDNEYRRWELVGGNLAMIVLDIDHFKRINDTYGHRAGDKALSLLAKIMRAQVRGKDFLARYGGEEFVMVLPDADVSAALSVAQKLIAAAREAPFNHHGERVPLTLSAGVAGLRPQESPQTLFERADAALYRAKQQGRDRVVVAD